VDENEEALTDATEPRVFDSVVSNLRKTYPKDKMQDISTSFCFICLLHLANERGLKIEVGDSPGAEDEVEPEEGDNKVGDLWGLKVKSPFHSPLCLVPRGLIVIVTLGLPRSNRHSLGMREGHVDTVRLHLIYSDTFTCFGSLCLFVYLTLTVLFLIAFRYPSPHTV
jgi:hypothetical protein